MDTLADTLWGIAVETEEHLQTVEPTCRTATGTHRRAGYRPAVPLVSIRQGAGRALDVLGMEGVAHHAENRWDWCVTAALR